MTSPIYCVAHSEEQLLRFARAIGVPLRALRRVREERDVMGTSHRCALLVLPDYCVTVPGPAAAIASWELRGGKVVYVTEAVVRGDAPLPAGLLPVDVLRQSRTR